MSVPSHDSPVTFFAPPERVPMTTIVRQRELLAAEPVVGTLLESFPEPAAIINDHRQIVRANLRFEQLAKRSEGELLGLRVGQAIGCQNSESEPAGCGTTPACALCGAARATARTQSIGEPTGEECRLTLKPELGGDSLDLQVWTTPIEIAGGRFAVFAIRDTSGEQRRRVLERMFFHDVLNAAGGLRDILRLWPHLTPEEAVEFSGRIAPLAAQVVEEIEAQRDLAAAERGELTARPVEIDVRELIEDLVNLYRHHSVATGKSIAVNMAGEATIITDGMLLRRVLGNLVKNALEASGAGQSVTISFESGLPTRFAVHNESVMPDAVRLQVFQRSFSTKGGRGRGVGTYSARLLAERHLRGRLTFTSAPGQGTIFVLELTAQEGTTS
ncbi:MAG TPA: HAMP domain-containing sensor histidine kinase [Vicinamibacterales bacterium]|jgi:hypothetical protein